MTTHAGPGRRGCGFRVKGGVYLETKLSPFGQPIENFLIDSPQRIDPDAMGIRPRGMTSLLREDATHLFDWVGGDYPNVVDFIEEARRKGISRRVLPSLLGDLTPQSRLLLLHPRAYMTNALDFWRALQATGRAGYPTVPCPSALRGDVNHPNLLAPSLALPLVEDDDWQLPVPWCLGCCWHDVRGGVRVGGDAQHPALVQGEVGDVHYVGWEQPEGVKPEYALGLFAAFPLTSIAIIRDPDDAAKVNELFAQVKDLVNGLPVFLEDA